MFELMPQQKSKIILLLSQRVKIYSSHLPSLTTMNLFKPYFIVSDNLTKIKVEQDVTSHYSYNLLVPFFIKAC